MSGPPSLVLEGDELEVVLLPDLGARIHRIRAFGVDLLRTPEDVHAHAADPFFWGGYAMAPWCNRASPGPMEVAGRVVDLAPNFPDGSAIHGQVYAYPWTPVGDGSLTVTGGADGWPWAYEVRVHPTVEGPSFRMRFALTNRSDAPMPAGLGWHPWFVRPLEVAVPAARAYRSNTGSTPEPEPVDATPFDLRAGAPVAGGLDATWSSPRPGRVALRWPRDRVEAKLDVETDGSPCVAVATPSEPDATAVEPQTHGPDGVRRLVNGEPDALALLAPGETLALEVRLTVRRLD
mgnify:CR=1 FL=1